MKPVDFSETIAAGDLKVSRSRHLIEYTCMKICTLLKISCEISVNVTDISVKDFIEIFTEISLKFHRNVSDIH